MLAEQCAHPDGVRQVKRHASALHVLLQNVFRCPNPARGQGESRRFQEVGCLIEIQVLPGRRGHHEASRRYA